MDQNGHVWHLFVVRTEKREELQKYLNDNGIQTLIHYPIAPNKQEAYKEFNHLSFSITEQIHNEVLSLPLSAVMCKKDIDKVIKMLNEY